MSKKKIFNIFELILQVFAIVLLFVDGAAVCWHKCGYTLSMMSLYSSVWKIIVLSLFAINAILCFVSIKQNNTLKDNGWHISFPIINVIAFIPFSNNYSHDCTTKLDIIAYDFSTIFYILLFVLTVIIFLSFIKRSFVPKEEKQPQQVINNLQETSNADELKKYKELLDSGIITQEEFDEKKKQLLGL